VLSSATTGIPAFNADATGSQIKMFAFKSAEAAARTSGGLELDEPPK
jgi:hypothetical protein